MGLSGFLYIVEAELTPIQRGQHCLLDVRLFCRNQSRRGRNASEHFSTVEMALCVVGA